MKSALPLLAFLYFLSSASAVERIPWLHSYDEATAASRKTAQPIFVDVYADWCQWCHKLDQEVYTDLKLIQYLKGYVVLKLNSEDNGEGSRLAEKYEIDGLPAMLVLDANGKLLNKLSGFMKADTMIQDLDQVRKLLDLERKDPANLQTNYELARQYLDREMYAEARRRFQLVLASPQATSVQKEKAGFSVALAEYYQGQLNTALRDLESYYRTYPAGASNEDALLLLSQVNIELKANARAVKYLREYMKKYSGSSNASRARQVLEALVKECKC